MVDTSIGSGGVETSVGVGKAMAEGSDPAWALALRALPGVEQFKQDYVKGQTLSKDTGCKVCWVQPRKDASGAGIPRACKMYERNDEQAVARWAQEVTILQTLAGDQHVVQFYAAYFSEVSLVTPARCHIVMELCKESLYDYVAFRCQVEYEDVQKWAKDMCMGLRHMHGQSILHRDMKPGNCLLQPNPAGRVRLKITDFGNSAFLIGCGGKQPLPCSKPLRPLMTTYRYSSPEVVRKQPYSFPLDMWSAGVVLWEILQEDARVPAVDWDHRRDSVSDLAGAVVVLCNKVTSYRHDASRPGIMQLACRLLEVAPETRPTAAQLVNDWWCSRSPMPPPSIGAPIGFGGVMGRAPTPLHGEQEGQGETGGEQPAEEVTVPMGLEGALDVRVVEAAVRFREFFENPGDVVAFCDGANQLTHHRGNVLLLYILAQAKYPTVVKDLAGRFAKIQRKLTANEVKVHCWAAIREAARVNETSALQQEMLIYDDQRMCCIQGLARVMEDLKLLRVSAPGTHSSNTIALGRGKPRLRYELVFDQVHMRMVVDNLGQTYIDVDGGCTHDKLMSFVGKFSTIFQDGLMKKSPSAFVRKRPSSGSGGRVGVQGSQKLSYKVLHYIRKHLIWLINQHEQVGTYCVNWHSMTLRELSKIMPDEADHLISIGGDVNAGKLAEVLRVGPMLISCLLCLVGRVLKRHDYAEALGNADNRDMILALKRDHEVSYGIPPSLWHLAKMCVLKLKGPEAVIPSVSGEADQADGDEDEKDEGDDKDEDDDDKGEDDKGDDKHEDHKREGEDADVEEASPAVHERHQFKRRRWKALPFPSDSGDAAQAVSVEEVRAHVDERSKWYHIPHVRARGKLKSCHCKGNCFSNCPARKKNMSEPRCPNPASVNLDESGYHGQPVALCAACTCRSPGCTTGARRPYKDYANVMANYGHCRKCWVKP